MNVYLESLGCARNLVDSEIMLGRLLKSGYKTVNEPGEADLIVVNTCSFIASAMDESIDTILALSEYKKNGRCSRLIVAGCLPERFGRDISDALPEVDLFLGTGSVTDIADAVNTLDTEGHDICVFKDPNSVSPNKSALPRQLSNPHMAYVKISEGCSRHCTYCIIPKLRGTSRSRSEEDILVETRNLVAEGVRELILVAESTTDYGMDLNPPGDLNILIGKIAAIPGEFRIRLLYGFPDTLSPDVIRTLGNTEKVCAYFDIPIQHAVDSVLNHMGRNYSRKDIQSLFTSIRKQFPAAALRTTLITGFPGESDHDFKELLSFIKEIRFDHVGVFTYSDSDDIPSHHLPDHVPPKKALKRHDRIMAAQAEISLEKNLAHVGNTYRVLIEENPEPGLYLGRTEFQAPDVDGLTFVYGDTLTIGEFIPVRITEAFEYDISGEPA